MASGGVVGFLKNLGILAGTGVAAAFFVVLPMSEASRGAERVILSFSGIVLSTMIFAMALNVIALGDKEPGKPRTRVQEWGMAVAVAVPFVALAVVWKFCQARGYSIGF